MQVIVGASGQVGSAIVRNLLARGEDVRAVVRNAEKGRSLQELGAELFVGDATELASMQAAVQDAECLFVITPQSGSERPALELTARIVANYRVAIEGSKLSRVIALSSMGAQWNSGTGTLLMSHMLEENLAGIGIPHAFVRPAYYFSNWLSGLDTARTKNILPGFFPADLSIPMIAPSDVAAYCSWLLTSETGMGKVYVLNGPKRYNAKEVAAAFSAVLGVTVKPAVIPREKWEDAMSNLGMTADAVKNFVEMTEAVVSGKAAEPDPRAVTEKAKTTLDEFLRDSIAPKTRKASAVAG